MAASFIDLIPNTLMEGLYIDIKTRSMCEPRKVNARTYAENWTTDVWGVGYAISQDEVKLWHPDDPVPEDLTQAISSGLPIISYDAPFVRALFVNIMRPRHSWPIPPLTQWNCVAAMAAAMDLPAGLDDAAKVMGIAERKDNEARSLIRRMTRPRCLLRLELIIDWSGRCVRILGQQRNTTMGALQTSSAVRSRAIHRRCSPANLDPAGSSARTRCSRRPGIQSL